VKVVPEDPIESTSAAEARVIEAIRHRGVADFTGLPADERQLHATFLEAVITGSGPEGRPLCCPLRIRGADIVGPIHAVPNSGSVNRLTLLFWSCDFDSPVDFSGANFLTLRLVDCTLPALIGVSLTTEADIDLSGSHFSGVYDHASDLADIGNCAVYLNHAHIGGRLRMSATPRGRFESRGSVSIDGARIDGKVELHGALLDDYEEPALSARSAIIGGNLELLPGQGHRCEVHGEVCLVAARITGDLDCSGARLVNPEGRALHCEDLVVESVFLSRDTPELLFEASGRLNFLTATVGGSFFLNSARLSPGPDLTGMIGRGGPVAVNLTQIRISNSFILFDVAALEEGGEDSVNAAPTPVRGWLLLTAAQMNALVHNVDNGWPAHGYLDLDGASYERIRHMGGGDLVSRSVAWLRRQYPQNRPDIANFRPQPYEQLTRVLRSSGLTREADAIAVEKIRMRLAARVDPPWHRVFPRILMLISHHGYSTSRAVLSFLLFVLLGAAMYTVAIRDFDQPFYPFEQPPEPTTYVLPFELGEKTVPLGCPGLDTLQYALDYAIPVINIGQDSFCRFVPEGPGRQLWLTLHSLFALLGAALSAVVILTLTGILRRD